MTRRGKRDRFDVMIGGLFVGHVFEDRDGRGFRFSRFRESPTLSLDGERRLPSSRQAIARMLLDELDHIGHTIEARELRIRTEQHSITKERARKQTILDAIERIRRGGPLDDIISREYLVEDSAA